MASASAPASAARLDDLLVKTSRTFALSIPALEEPTRREVTLAYLLFRIADTLEDATDWPRQRKLDELAAFGDLLRRREGADAGALAARWLDAPPVGNAGYLELLSELPAVMAAFEALGEPARGQVRTHTLRTVERMSGFVGRAHAERGVELHEVTELREYCYAVAGIVGEMLTELFLLGCPGLETVATALRRRAPRFGEALQLVNILKDSATDAREGRRYLPQAVDRGQVFALARGDLAQARDYVLDLQRHGAPRGMVQFTALPVLLARATLDRVERDGPGTKLTRDEVGRLAAGLDRALADGAPAVP